MVAGNPARVRKKRFAPEVCQELLRIAWWEWPDDKIEQALPLLMNCDVLGFVQAFGKGF